MYNLGLGELLGESVVFEDSAMEESDRIAIAVLEQKARNTDASLNRLEKKMDSGFERLEGRVERLDAKVDSGLSGILDLLGGKTAVLRHSRYGSILLKDQERLHL